MADGVRIATRDDLPALLALYQQLSPGPEPEADAARAALQAILAEPRVSLLVAERDGAVVGTVTLVVVPNLTHGARPWAQLENMVVDEALRSTGAGRELLDAAVALAWDAGCYKVQLQSANRRDGAHRFYERAGFVASSKGYRLYRE